MDSRARFEALYRAHCGVVRSFVHRRVPAAAADDVVAEVFVHAWRRLDRAPEDPLPWLLSIARGLIANRRRADARQVALRDRLAAMAAPAPAEPMQDDTHESELMRALRGLGRLDQEVLLLVAWDGLDRVQAARTLGITPGLFGVRLHRARRRLERAIGAQQLEGRQDAADRAGMEVSPDGR